MKTILAILSLLVAFPSFAADCTWSAITGATRSRQGVGAASCTLTPATADAAAGMWLNGVGGFSVWVCADAGQTITTAFSLTAYAQEPYSLLWGPQPQWDATTTATGARCIPIGSGFQVDSPAGRVAYGVSAGAVSSGNITIKIVATGIGRYDGFELL
jgi:hypothetical protein